MLSSDVRGDQKMLFMEYFSPVEFDEFSVDAYYSKSGELKCLVPRKRIEVRGGEISKGLAVKGRTYEYLRDTLGTIEGARGCLTLQFFVSKTEARTVASELNPRFGGGYPLTYFAGADYPEWLIREYLLCQSVPFYSQWSHGTGMVRYDSEIIFSAEGE
jgi:carbamoyl-phosphate synthase large subunit